MKLPVPVVHGLARNCRLFQVSVGRFHVEDQVVSGGRGKVGRNVSNIRDETFQLPSESSEFNGGSRGRRGAGVDSDR